MLADKIYRAEIESYAAGYSYKLGRIFEDIDFSGRKGSQARPGFADMLQRAEAGEFDLLIVPKLSRFGRSMRDNLDAYDRLEAADIGIAFLDLRVDTTTSGGKLMRNLMTSLAEYESDLISERWRDTHKFLADQGRSNGSTPYGYRYDSEAKQLFVVPGQARIVQEVFERFIGGETLRGIAVDLTRRNVKSQRGEKRRWMTSHLSRMIDNPAYAGWRQLRWHRDEAGERVEATWEPVIDRETFEHAQALRNATKARTPAERRQGKGRHMLSGLLYCPCGEPMWRNSQRDEGRSVWDCRKARAKRRGDCAAGMVTAKRVERLVTEAFLETLATPFAKEAMRAPRDVFPEIEDEDDLDARIADVERRMERVVELLVDAGPGEDKLLRAKMSKLEDERAEIDRERAKSVTASTHTRRRVEDLKELRRRLADLPAIIEAATPIEKNEMFRLAIDRVELVEGAKPKQVRIVWADWLELEPTVTDESARNPHFSRRASERSLPSANSPCGLPAHVNRHPVTCRQGSEPRGFTVET